MSLLSEIQQSGTYFNENTNTYELWLASKDEQILVGLISGFYTKAQKNEIERYMWARVINPKKESEL